MKTSPRGVLLIKKHETFCPVAYKPTSADVWTCGFGHTRGITATTTCSQQQADFWLRDDLYDAEVAVNAHVTVPLTQNQFDALVSFVFNLGPGALEHSTMLLRLNDGQYIAAADELLRWIRQGKDVMHGLTVRRADERTLFLT